MTDIRDTWREMAKYQNTLPQDWSRELENAADTVDRLAESLRKVTDYLADMPDLTDDEWQSVEDARSALEEVTGYK